MPITAPETEARAKLSEILQEVFGSESFPIKQGKLHGSYGADSETTIGIFPTTSTPGAPPTRNLLVQGSEITVQLYGKWEKEVDPLKVVDPTVVEERAERFRRQLKNHDVDSSGVWFFNLLRVRYPDDPTGQKTRFEADVMAFGNNSALIETTG